MTEARCISRRAVVKGALGGGAALCAGVGGAAAKSFARASQPGGRDGGSGRKAGLALVPTGHTLLFVGQAVEPAVRGSMEEYVRHMGEVPAGFMFYLILSGDRQRTRRELATMQVLLERHPGTAVQLGLGLGAQLTGNVAESLHLLAGAYDVELTSLAQWLRSLDRAVFLRPLYEFDRACATYGEPELFKRAYRYIVDRLRADGADRNISWVWHSAGPGYRLDDAGFYAIAGSLSRRLDGRADPLIEAGEPEDEVADLCPVADFYPGEGYVDYFAISYWGEGSFVGPGTADARRRYERAVRRLLRQGRALGLPLMIAESTPAYIGTTSGRRSVDWMNRYFDLVEEYDIRVVSYIAAPWSAEGGNWGSPAFNGFFPDDARLHVARRVKATWYRRTGAPRYHQRSDTDINALLRHRPTPKKLPWSARPEAPRERLRWPECPPPSMPGTGGWCLPPLP